MPAVGDRSTGSVGTWVRSMSTGCRTASPAGDVLFRDVTFRVGDGEHVALVGANGAGKTTLFARHRRRAVAGRRAASTSTAGCGSCASSSAGATRTGRSATCCSRLSPPRAPARPADAGRGRGRAATASPASAPASRWPGPTRRGATRAAGTPRCSGTRARTIAVRQPFDAAGGRRLVDAVGRRAEAARARGAAPLRRRRAAARRARQLPRRRRARSGSRTRSRASPKTILLDQPRPRAARRGRRTRSSRSKASTAWTHGASFATWHEARDDAPRPHRRGAPALAGGAQAARGSRCSEFRRRASMGSDKFASRVPGDEDRRSSGSRRRRRPSGSSDAAGVDAARRRSHRQARRRCASSSSCTGSPTRSTPRSCSASASRCSVRTAPARATSCACSRASRSSTTGRGALGARVVPGYFSQTHDQPELRGVAVARRRDEGAAPIAGGRWPRCAATGCTAARPAAVRDAVGRSAGPAADPPARADRARTCCCSTSRPTTSTSRRPRRSRRRSTSFVGTVVAVTHDRWFMRTFDRFLVFGRDCTVTEHLEPVFA